MNTSSDRIVIQSPLSVTGAIKRSSHMIGRAIQKPRPIVTPIAKVPVARYNIPSRPQTLARSLGLASLGLCKLSLRLCVVGLACFVACVYVAVAALWTASGILLFGVLMIPWRMFRRSGRKARVTEQRHAELMKALNR